MTAASDPRRAIARLAVATVVADGRVGADEIIALDELDLLGLGHLSATAREEMARAAEEPIDVAGTCERLAGLGPQTAAIILTVLAHLAAGDGQVSRPECEVFETIATCLGVAAPEATRILRAASAASEARRAPERTDAGAAPEPTPVVAPARPAQAWRLFGIEPGASLEHLAAAYLAAVERYDPVKVVPLGPEFVVLAVRKLGEITDAFEQARAAGDARARHDDGDGRAVRLDVCPAGLPPRIAGPQPRSATPSHPAR